MNNSLTLDMRSDEGRVQVSVDLNYLTHPERLFLFGLLQSAHKGAQVGFGVGNGSDEQTKVIQFTLTNPVAQQVSDAVRTALVK